MERSLEDLQARAMRAKRHPGLVALAAANMPSSAHKLALGMTHNTRLAASTRFLAIIRRDFGEEAFHDFVAHCEMR